MKIVRMRKLKEVVKIGNEKGKLRIKNEKENISLLYSNEYKDNTSLKYS